MDREIHHRVTADTPLLAYFAGERHRRVLLELAKSMVDVSRIGLKAVVPELITARQSKND
jgi:hypothetical protein